MNKPLTMEELQSLLSKLSAEDVVSTLSETLGGDEGGTYKYRIINPTCPKYFRAVKAFDLLMAWWRSDSEAFVFPHETVIALGTAVKTQRAEEEDDDDDENVLDDDDELFSGGAAVKAHDFYTKISLCVPDAVADIVQKYAVPLSTDDIRRMLVDETAKNPQFFAVIMEMMKSPDPFAVIIKEEKKKEAARVAAEEFKLREERREQQALRVPEGPARTAYNAAVSGTDTVETNKYFAQQLTEVEDVQGKPEFANVETILAKRAASLAGGSDTDHLQSLQFLATNADVPLQFALPHFSAAVVGSFNAPDEECENMLLPPSHHQLAVQGSSSLAGNTFFPYSEGVAFFVGRTAGLAELLQPLAKQTFSIDFMQRLLNESRILPITPDTPTAVLGVETTTLAMVQGVLIPAVRQLAMILLLEEDGTASPDTADAFTEATLGNTEEYLDAPVNPLVHFILTSLLDDDIPVTSKMRDVPTRVFPSLRSTMGSDAEIQQKWCEVAACEMLVQAFGLSPADQVGVAALTARPQEERVLVGAALLHIHRCMKQIDYLNSNTPDKLQPVTSFIKWAADKSTGGVVSSTAKWVFGETSKTVTSFLSSVRSAVTAMPRVPIASANLLAAAKRGVESFRGIEVLLQALSVRTQSLVERIQVPVGPNVSKSLPTVAHWSSMTTKMQESLSPLSTELLKVVFQQMQGTMNALATTFHLHGNGDTWSSDACMDSAALGFIQGAVVDSLLLADAVTVDMSKTQNAIGYATANLEVGGSDAEAVTLVLRSVLPRPLDASTVTRINTDLLRFTSMFTNPFARVYFSLIRGYTAYKKYVAATWSRGVGLWGRKAPAFVNDAQFKLEPTLADIGKAIVSTDKALMGADGGYDGSRPDADVALDRFAHTFPSLLGEIELVAPSIHGKQAHALPVSINDEEVKANAAEYVKQASAVWATLEAFKVLPIDQLSVTQTLWFYLSELLQSEDPMARFGGVTVTHMLQEGLEAIKTKADWKDTGGSAERRELSAFSSRVGFMMRVGKTCSIVSNSVAKWQLCKPKHTMPPIPDYVKGSVQAKALAMLKRIANAAVRRAFSGAFSLFIRENNFSGDMDKELDINRGVIALERKLKQALPTVDTITLEFANTLYTGLSGAQKTVFDAAVREAIGKMNNVFMKNKTAGLFVNRGLLIRAPLFIRDLAARVLPADLILAKEIAAEASIAVAEDAWARGSSIRVDIVVGGVNETWEYDFVKVVEASYTAHPLDGVVMFLQSIVQGDGTLSAMNAMQNVGLVTLGMLAFFASTNDTTRYAKLWSMAEPATAAVGAATLHLSASEALDKAVVTEAVNGFLDKNLSGMMKKFKTGMAAEAAQCFETTPIAVLAARDGCERAKVACSGDEKCLDKTCSPKDMLPQTMMEGRDCATAKEWFDNRGRVRRLFGF